jgi:quinol monooxygenase YgiN
MTVRVGFTVLRDEKDSSHRRRETPMHDHVFWILEADIKAGQLDTLKALMREMVEGTQRDEPGALNYEWFIADDGKSLHLYERYADPDAAMVHRENFAQKYRERFVTCLTITKMTLYGNLTSEIRAAFAPPDRVYMSMADGFAR